MWRECIHPMYPERAAVMFDTGFGIYHHAIMDMLPRFGLDSKELTRIYLTHSDAGPLRRKLASTMYHAISIQVLLKG